MCRSCLPNGPEREPSPQSRFGLLFFEQSCSELPHGGSRSLTTWLDSSDPEPSGYVVGLSYHWTTRKPPVRGPQLLGFRPVGDRESETP